LTETSQIEQFRVEFELFANIVPKTAENFLLLSSTKKYKDSVFHRLVKDFMIQGGDYENFNGTGGSSIYGKTFEDENFIYEHSEPGLLSMANSGPNKNGSQFFITFKECSWLNGKHVVFGRVIKGLDKILSLNNFEVGQDDRPLKVIKIIDCDMIPKSLSDNQVNETGVKN
jgi:cyclophilin family peptidyl-prolyl cis-trans isomerase